MSPPPDTAPDPGSDRVLRDLVLGLRARFRRRRFPVRVCVGDPGGALASVELVDDLEPGGLDLALMTELVAALLLAVPEQGRPLAWLERPGVPAWHDLDALWLPAAVAAYAEAGLPLTAVVVTKQGWYDPRTGAGRQWKRLRQRRAPTTG